MTYPTAENGTTACKWDVVIPFTKYIISGKKVLYEDEYIYNRLQHGENFKKAKEDFNIIAKDGLWEQYKRIIKDNGAIVLTASQPFTSVLIMSNLNNFKYCWTWDKITAKGHLVAKIRPLQQTEDIVVFGKNRINYNPIMIDRPKNKIQYTKEAKRTEIMGGQNKMLDKKIYDKYYPKTLLTYKTERGLHPTQKPVALFEYLIKTYTNEGDVVLDNCAGSGTTAIACLNTKRDFILMEKEEKYYNIINKRISNYYENII